jgi:N-acetylmuramoyl-L-alanine amidase
MTNLSVARASLFLWCWLIFSSTGLGRPSVVVIDPGHGGHDRGGIPGQRLAEKVYTPAILVECGFLTNPAEAARITESHSRERLAQAIADAILRYD